MIFEQEYVVFEILDVMYLNQSDSKSYNSNRDYDSMSMRFEADTILKTENSEIHLSDNSISYGPAKLNYTRLAKRDVLVAVNFKVLNYHTNEIEYFTPENPEKYRALFKELLDTWNSGKPGFKSECSAILNKIFAQCYRDNLPQDTCKKLYPGVQYIKKNLLNKDFSLSVAAQKSFMSETYFRKLFNKEFGISPKKFVIESRMKHAQSLIHTNYYSLQEISDLCGYNDYKHFSAEFKKFTGIAPSRYYYHRQESTILSEETI